MSTTAERSGQNVIRMPMMSATAPLMPRVVRMVLIDDFESSAASTENEAKHSGGLRRRHAESFLTSRRCWVRLWPSVS